MENEKKVQVTKIGPFRNFGSSPNGNIRTRMAKQAPKDQGKYLQCPRSCPSPQERTLVSGHRTWAARLQGPNVNSCWSCCCRGSAVSGAAEMVDGQGRKCRRLLWGPQSLSQMANPQGASLPRAAPPSRLKTELSSAGGRQGKNQEQKTKGSLGKPKVGRVRLGRG